MEEDRCPKKLNLPVHPALVTPAGGWPRDGRRLVSRPTSEIQGLLKRLGFYNGTIDDGYGPQTSEAVGMFQFSNWLEVDGSWGMTSDGIGFPPVGSVHGVDYSWARPGGALLQERGINLAGRYLWQSAGNKGISRAEFDDLKTHNIDPFFFFETSAEDSMAKGFNTGRDHAKRAEEYLTGMGLSGYPIYFNVDHDSDSSMFNAIEQGLKGAQSIIGFNRVGLYAEYEVVKEMFDRKAMKYACQTYAWSGGKWDPRAQLQQWSNGQWNGDIDFTRAIMADFGQNPVG